MEFASKEEGANLNLLKKEEEILKALSKSFNSKIKTRKAQIADLNSFEDGLEVKNEREEFTKSGTEIQLFDVSKVESLENYSDLEDEARQTKFKEVVSPSMYEELAKRQLSNDKEGEIQTQRNILEYLNNNEIEILSAAAKLNKGDKKAFHERFPRDENGASVGYFRIRIEC